MKKKQSTPSVVNQVIQLMKEGKSNRSIEKHLFKNNPEIKTLVHAKKVVSEAEQILDKEHFRKTDDVINLHVTRYHKEINRLLTVEELDENDIGITITREEWQRSRDRKIKALDKGLNTMAQLENLLQLHHPDFTLELNIAENIEIVQEKPKYDLSKLTFDEQCELLDLMELAKKDQNEIGSVIQAIAAPKVETEDIAHEVIEEANIEKITHTQPPPEQTKTLYHPEKLQQTLKRLAAQRLKDAGAKLDQDEQKLLTNQ